MASGDWWAARGSRYQHEKGDTAGASSPASTANCPVCRPVQMTDIATPLTF